MTLLLPNIMFLPLFGGLIQQLINQGLSVLVNRVSSTGLKCGLHLESCDGFIVDEEFQEFQKVVVLRGVHGA